MIRKAVSSLVAIAAFAGLVTPAAANDYTVAIQKMVDSDVRNWAQSDQVVAAVKEQNKKSAGLSQSDIDSQDK